MSWGSESDRCVRTAITCLWLSLLSVKRNDNLALRLGPDDHFGDDEPMASGDLVAHVLLSDFGSYIGDRDMRLIRMGWLDELYDFSEALMEQVQLWTLNVRDDDGNLSGC
jgi:hypothetical protein